MTPPFPITQKTRHSDTVKQLTKAPEMNTFSNVDLIALVERDLGQGRRSGRWMQFHCPFPGHKHGDRNPSLSVSNGDGSRGPIWKCFACGMQGNPAKWLMEFRSMSYSDAL